MSYQFDFEKLEISNHRVTKAQSSQKKDFELENKISQKIIKCAIEVHKYLGPGLLESIYEECLCKEFEISGLKYDRQKEIPIIYKNTELSGKYKIDLIVENLVIVEIKCVESILPVHQAQLLTYLRLTGLKLGLILNFNTDLMKKRYKKDNFVMCLCGLCIFVSLWWKFDTTIKSLEVKK